MDALNSVWMRKAAGDVFHESLERFIRQSRIFPRFGEFVEKVV